jgi:polyhydroxyalkanoate synthesis repressor PhaR
MSDARVIRKYANRRLYDTESSKHINHDDVRRLIADGLDVKVIDDTSGEDITRGVLLQLVAEQERGGRPVLSDQMLMHIIRFYEHPMQGVFGAWLQQSFETFLQQQQNLQEQVKNLFGSGPFAALQEMAMTNIEAWKSMQEAVTKPETTVTKPETGKDDD